MQTFKIIEGGLKEESLLSVVCAFTPVSTVGNKVLQIHVLLPKTIVQPEVEPRCAIPGRV